MSRLPTITVQPGDHYFSVDGRQSVLFTRNLAGVQRSDYDPMLDWMAKAGSRVARVGLDNMVMGGVPGHYGYGFDGSGNIVAEWDQNWRDLFQRAASRGIYVLPVFTGWANWNPPEPGTENGWTHNPFNDGSRDPADLFKRGTYIHDTWLGWLANVVGKWGAIGNILAWEVYSEANLTLVSASPDVYVPEAAARSFVEAAAQAVRGADPAGRPITASLGGGNTNPWFDFYKSPSLDFIQIHPYEPGGNLDTDILRMIRQNRTDYGKPVLIGESGLCAAEPMNASGGQTTLTTAPRAAIGIKHAIWAGMLSGAMNARALFWEDSFGIYFPPLGWPFLQKYADMEEGAAQFIKGLDLAKFEPLPISGLLPPTLVGALLGSWDVLLGWLREPGCVPPDWPVARPVVKKRPMFTIPLPTSAKITCQVDFYDTSTGKIIGATTVSSSGSGSRNGLTIPLPDLPWAGGTGDIAFKAIRKTTVPWPFGR
ncbi:MAG TPA: hypothetical protein VMC09_16335 [Anaerolineales bacterium]|nr:hypothetical protein [Anaerolineales bacterium]